jgi:hypothetical protein
LLPEKETGGWMVEKEREGTRERMVEKEEGERAMSEVI